MPVEITESTSCAAPVDVAFDYVADYHHVSEWLWGIEAFEPVGDLDYGLGSVFDAKMQLGVPVKSRIEVNRWTPNRLIGFDSVKGFKVSSAWNFEPAGEGRTLITAQVTYSLPFGPAGKAMGKIMGPVVKQAVARSADKLRQNIEAAYAG